MYEAVVIYEFEEDPAGHVTMVFGRFPSIFEAKEFASTLRSEEEGLGKRRIIKISWHQLIPSRDVSWG